MVALLSSYNLYTDAVRLSNGFKLSVAPVLESLTINCVNAINEDNNEAMDWLFENLITDLLDAVGAAWSLLRDLIQTNEKIDSTELHKCVTRKILNLGAFLPQWLYSSYKIKNTPELLNLLVSCGRLIEATDLAIEYIRAMMEGGIEYLGLKNVIHSTLPPQCFPINTIDLLLYGLQLNMKEKGDEANEYKEVI